MRVKVLNNWETTLLRMGENKQRTPTFFIRAGQEHTVYGLSWLREPAVAGWAGPVCEITDDHGNLVSAPIEIFDVIDSHVPDVWRVVKGDSGVFLWPEVFLKDFFFDDLSEGVPECVEEFRNLQELLGGADGPA